MFSHIIIKKKLEIIKNNKNIQKKLEKKINDYKKYNNEKTPIEIEVTLDRNNKYINIENINKEYYHCYVDSNKIKIIMDYNVKSFSNLFFFSCNHIQSITFKKFYRKKKI